MPITLTNVVGPIVMPNGVKPKGAVVVFQPSSFDKQSGVAVITGGATSVALDGNADFSASLAPRDAGQNAITYNVSLVYSIDGTSGPISMTDNYGPIVVPMSGPVDIETLIQTPITTPTPPDILAQALAAQAAAAASANNAAASAASSSSSATDAAQSATDADQSATDAQAALAQMDIASRAEFAALVGSGDILTGEIRIVAGHLYQADPMGTDGALRVDMDFSGSKNYLSKRLIAGDAVKIAVFGDSSVEGGSTTGGGSNPVDGSGNAIGSGAYAAPNAWPAKLQEYLRGMFNQNVLEVYNAGYGSRSIWGGWAQENFDAAIVNNPDYSDTDYVFLSFGLNDATFAAIDDSDTFETRIWALCDRIDQVGAIPVICLPDAVLQNTNRQGDNLSDVTAVLTQVAERFKIPLIDFNTMENEYFSRATGLATWSKSMPDELHFGDLGHRLKAGYAAAVINPNTLWLTDTNLAVSPFSKHCNTGALTHNVFENANNRFGSTMNVVGDTYTTGQTLIDLWVWNIGAPKQAFYRELDGSGFNYPRDIDDAPTITLDDFTNSTTVTVKSATAGMQAGTAGLRQSEAPCLVSERMPNGLSRLQFKAATDATDQPVYLGYFDFRKECGVNEIAFAIPTGGSGNETFVFDKTEETHALVGFGDGQSFNMFLEASIPNGAGLVLWGGRVFTGTDYEEDGRQAGLMLYRNDTTGNISLWDLSYDNTGLAILGTSKASAAYTFTGNEKFRIKCFFSGGHIAKVEVIDGWSANAIMLSYTVDWGEVPPVWGGADIPCRI